MKDVVLDLETLGTGNNSAIIAIGSAHFDIKTGEILKEFYVNVDLQSSIDAGLTVDGDTVYFWLKQSEKARMDLFRDRVKLQYALEDFSEWSDDINGSKNLWGNGVSFDNVILKNAYNKLGIKFPYHYRDDQDVRTLVKLAKRMGLLDSIKKEMDAGLTKHNALDDAIHEAKYISDIWNRINGRRR